MQTVTCLEHRCITLCCLCLYLLKNRLENQFQLDISLILVHFYCKI